MRRISYVSENCCAVSDTRLLDIVRACDAHNAHAGITGRLAVSKTHFLQMIEGDETSLQNLWSSIQRDTRHRVLLKFEDEEIAHRRYAEFKVQYFPGIFSLPDDFAPPFEPRPFGKRKRATKGQAA